MDNSKTGALIKELRKEKGLTQSQLAERLHITDRAVSKWERGLCAPDIALLEPLSAILGVSVVELLEGKRRISDDLVEELDVNAKNILIFSKEEIKRKTKSVRLKSLLTAAICLAVVLLIGGLILQRGGYLFVIDKSRSPDGTIDVTVYGKDFADYGGFSNQDGVALIVDRPDNGSLRVSYGDCTYQGLWWAPDSRKYVISLQYGGQRHLALAWLDKSSESNLSAYLAMGVNRSELAQHGLSYDDDIHLPDVDYQFLQWSEDSSAMLIYYTFTDTEQSLHTGYFWYDCEDGNVYAPFPLKKEA